MKIKGQKQTDTAWEHAERHCVYYRKMNYRLMDKKFGRKYLKPYQVAGKIDLVFAGESKRSRKSWKIMKNQEQRRERRVNKIKPLE